MTHSISLELNILNLSGSRIATQIVDDRDLEEAGASVSVSFEAHGYNSVATTPDNEGCLLDITLGFMGDLREKREDESFIRNHRIEVNATFTKTEARALRDFINTFLELE